MTGTTSSSTDRLEDLQADHDVAVFDAGHEYRYVLSRTWDPERPTLGWIMLNPSTADETDDDPTIRRCIGFARDWGYGSITVANLFALRATDPDVLGEHTDPVGAENDSYLRAVCEFADDVVAAWGSNGALHGRGRTVVELLDADLYAIDTTTNGHPVHPLYQPADAQPERWNGHTIQTASDR